MADDTSRISPTAHYTAYVWYRNGLSHRALASPTGRLLYRTLQPMNAAYRRLGRTNLEDMLLARHGVIDELLERAVASGEVEQVIEIAAGLSPRGHRFTRRFPGLTYVEADLPAMAARKRAALDRAGLRGPRHHVVAVNALADDGDESVAAVARRLLDPRRGTAIITEGLLGYFELADVRRMWARFARVLRGFARGRYLADLSLAGDLEGMRAARWFTRLLEVFARGRVHLHFADAAAAEAALLEAGFRTATLHGPPSADRVVMLVEASV